jgi:hypothetical protein
MWAEIQAVRPNQIGLPKTTFADGTIESCVDLSGRDVSFLLKCVA